MYNGGDPFWLWGEGGVLWAPRMSWDWGRDAVALKRMPVNRLAATHSLLPSLPRHALGS